MRNAKGRISSMRRRDVVKAGLATLAVGATGGIGGLGQALAQTKMVMKAVLNVLQDDGFIIKNANENLGLIAATKETENPDTPALLWLRTELRWDKTFVFECSANVSEFGHQTKVRVNFEERTINNRGEVSHVKQVDDAKYYRDFFAKVDKGIFIQKEKL